MSEEHKGNGGGERRPPAGRRMTMVWLLLLAAGLGVYQWLTAGAEPKGEMKYSDFLGYLRGGRVSECTVTSGTDGVGRVEGTLKDMDPEAGDFQKFRVTAPVTDDLVDELKAAGVPFDFKTGGRLWIQLLAGVVPMVVFFILFYYLFIRNAGGRGGAFTFGKSRAQKIDPDQKTVTFKDVAGVDEAREEVQEIIEFLKDPKKFQRLGGRIPKGVLLVGPPGTGKTLIARAIAGEAGVPFFTNSGSDFVEMFVGVGASRVRDMFEEAKKNAPCIVFIDEIDAVGRSRFTGIGGGHDEREQTLNALLTQMDGFEAQEGIITIAATNRPDVLDPALLRPGRFDRQVVVDLPTLEGREAILQLHARKVKLGEDADLHATARGTPGFSGADLANLINEAALLAARRDADAVGKKDLEEARDKVRWGRERRSRKMDDQEKRMTAIHESGHALAMLLTEGTEPLHKVTIIPRGRSLGATFQLPEKERFTESRTQLLGMIVGAMGGRVAERLCLGEISTGASQDIKQATQIARLMVTEWGMSDKLGAQYFGQREELLFLGREVSRSNEISAETARTIDEEVKRILDECHAKATELLTANKEKLELVAETLLERETLDGQEVQELVKHGRILTAAERRAEEQGAGGGATAETAAAPTEGEAAPATEALVAEAPAPEAGAGDDGEGGGGGDAPGETV